MSLELITVRQIVVIAVVVTIVVPIGVAVASGRGSGGIGRDSRSSSGRHGERLAAGRRGNDDRACNTEDFANVYVGAVGVDLRIVLVEKGSVHIMSSGDGIAGITLNHSCQEK